MENIAIIILNVVAAVAILFASGYACKRWGLKILAVVAPACLAIIVGLVVQYGFFQLLLFTLVTGTLTGLAFRYKKSAGFIVMASTFILATVSIAGYYYLKNIRSIDVIAVEKARSIDVVNANAPNKDEAANAMIDIDKAFEYANKFLPAIMFISALMISVAGQAVLRPWLAKRNSGDSIKGIEFFKLNDYVVFVLLAGMATVLYLFKTDSPHFLTAVNGLIIVGTLYFVQGIGVVKHFFIRRNIPTVLIPVFIISMIITGLFGTVLFTLIAVIGVLDLWADFRKLSDKNTAAG